MSKTMPCHGCNRKFPAELIQPFFSTEGNAKLCPICALERRNKLHGLPPNTPFQGGEAHRLWTEALEYLAKNLTRNYKRLALTKKGKTNGC